MLKILIALGIGFVVWHLSIHLCSYLSGIVKASYDKASEEPLNLERFYGLVVAMMAFIISALSIALTLVTV